MWQINLNHLLMMKNSDILRATEDYNYLSLLCEHYSHVFKQLETHISILEQICPAREVSRTELQRSINHDSLIKIYDVDPGTFSVLNWKGKTSDNTPRIEVCFYLEAANTLDFNILTLPKEQHTIDNEIIDEYRKFISEVSNKQIIEMMNIAIKHHDANLIIQSPSTLESVHVFKDYIKQFEKTVETDLKEIIVHPDTFDKFIEPLRVECPNVFTITGKYEHSTLYGKKLIKSLDVPLNKIYLCNGYFGIIHLILNKPKVWFSKKEGRILQSAYKTVGYAITNAEYFCSITLE